MPLTRYQIRNEYCLADTDLYGAADRDDPEALLEGVAMAGLVGVLRQLGDLAEFAADIFCCLHEELMATAARGHGLMIRLHQLEAEFPSVERAVLSQTDHLTFFSDPGTDWHPYLRTEENLIACGDLPRCIMDSYEECRGPPPLFLLDKFDVAGVGSCLKRYSDPSLFKTQKVSELTTSNIRIVKKSRKVKKKGSRGMNEETPEAAPTSHAKLHQLFLMDHFDSGHRDSPFHVKLKRRQLNGSPINLSSRRSYMEKLVRSPLPDHKIAPESHSKLSFDTVRNGSDSESGTLYKSYQAIETEDRACNVQEILPTPSTVYSNCGNAERNLEMEPQPVADDVEIPCTPQKGTRIDKPLTNLEVVPESCLEVSDSLDLTNTVDNYIDVPASVEPEKETDSIDKPNASDLGRMGVGEHGTYLVAPETQMEVPAWFFHVLHHSLGEEESNTLLTDFSSCSPESKLPNNKGSDETADASFVQHSVNKDFSSMGTLELEETPPNLSSCENPQNLPHDTGSYLQLCSEILKADEFGMNLSEFSVVPKVGRGTLLSISPEALQEYLSELPLASSEAEQSNTDVLLTNYTYDCNDKNVFNEEIESEISFSVLMDDQFTSLSNQEILRPESISSGVDVSLSAIESNSKVTRGALDSDKTLPTQDVDPGNCFEDLSLVAVAHEDTIAEEDKTHSENRCSMNAKTGYLTSFSGISSKDRNLMPVADLKTGSEHLSASSSHSDSSMNLDLAERPSYSEHVDMLIKSMVADDSDHKETISKDGADTLSCQGSFSSDADHNQTGLSNIALETMHESDLRTSVLPDSTCCQQENLLVTQECHSSDSWDQGQDSPLEHAPVDTIATSAESLPSDATAHDVSIDLHDLPSIEPAIGVSNSCLESDIESPWLTSHMQNRGKALHSGLTELESLHAADKERFTSLDDHCSEPILSMDQADEENRLDTFPVAAPPCSVLYEVTQAGPDDTPPLPPLPPTQWWIGKLIESMETSEQPFSSVASPEASGNSSACVHMDEYTVQAVSTAEDSVVNKTEKATEALFPSFTAGGRYSVSDHTGENTPNGSVKTIKAPFSSVASLAAGEAAPAADWESENPEIEHFERSSRERSDPQPAISMSRTGNIDEKYDIGQRGPEGETKIVDAFKPSQALRDKTSYENPEKAKLLGHKASIDNTVIAIDRSMLKKASEWARPPVGPRVIEQDSLLEIIRSKSFNLRPAAALARPNVQAVPITNLRIAAILEKASSLRQAMAGSDDDNDSDSWSDT